MDKQVFLLWENDQITDVFVTEELASKAATQENFKIQPCQVIYF